ncbi:MAG: CheY-like chemotaxis protein, partial [Bacteroidia bacterium]
MTKILIAEDEPAMRTGLTDNLEFEGYEVSSVSNGREALDILENQQFDLV